MPPTRAKDSSVKDNGKASEAGLATTLQGFARGVCWFSLGATNKDCCGRSHAEQSKESKWILSLNSMQAGHLARLLITAKAESSSMHILRENKFSYGIAKTIASEATTALNSPASEAAERRADQQSPKTGRG